MPNYLISDCSPFSLQDIHHAMQRVLKVVDNANPDFPEFHRLLKATFAKVNPRYAEVVGSNEVRLRSVCSEFKADIAGLLQRFSQPPKQQLGRYEKDYAAAVLIANLFEDDVDVEQHVRPPKRARRDDDALRWGRKRRRTARLALPRHTEVEAAAVGQPQPGAAPEVAAASPPPRAVPPAAGATSNRSILQKMMSRAPVRNVNAAAGKQHEAMPLVLVRTRGMTHATMPS